MHALAGAGDSAVREHLAPVSAARKCSRGVRSRLLARMNNLPYTYVVVRARGSASSKLTKGFVGEVHSWQFSVDPRELGIKSKTLRHTKQYIIGQRIKQE
jgi:hypothetical protein